jgi:hypothetical protein
MKSISSPDQGSLFNQDLLADTSIVNPGISKGQEVTSPPVSALNYNPALHDPNRGLVTPVIEGWTMLHDVLNIIGKDRRGRAFVRLPDDSKPVAEFAIRNGVTGTEAQVLVSENKHREEAQYRLSSFADKQRRLALGHNRNRPRPVFDDQLIMDIKPMQVADIERNYFNATSPAEARLKERRRKALGRFVTKHTRQ